MQCGGHKKKRWSRGRVGRTSYKYRYLKRVDVYVFQQQDRLFCYMFGAVAKALLCSWRQNSAVYKITHQILPKKDDEEQIR